MKTRIWPAIGAGALFSLSAAAQTAPEVTLTRIECGTAAKTTNVAERFSDTFAYKPDLALTFTFSCYLIKHGDVSGLRGRAAIDPGQRDRKSTRLNSSH